MAILKSLIFAAGVWAGACAAFAQDDSARLHRFFEEEWEYQIRESPELATSVGRPEGQDRLSDLSREAIERRKEHARDARARLVAIERGGFDAEDQLNYDLYLRDLELDIAGQKFPDELLRIDQQRGIQQDLASLIERMPARTAADYENVIARLRAVPHRVDQELALLRDGLAKGVTPPKITLREVPEQVLNQIPDDPEASALLAPFMKMPESVPAQERDRLKAAAIEAYLDGVVPSFKKLHAFIEKEYIPGARENIAASSLPDGDAWYAHQVQVMTTTDMTPKEIHELGLSEIKRICGEMDAIIKSLEFQGAFADFCEFLRKDTQFYFNNANALIAEYRDIAKRIDPGLPSLFATLPRLTYGVRPIPSYAEKSQTTAYYQPGSPDAGRPGYFYANTYALDTRPKWEMEALTAHEAVPGHHLQIAIAQELGEVPEFRRWGGVTAFVEGWGLYAESLGQEIGLYQDPYSKFGQLTYEIWRAIRLVVDTGMHQFGWARQQAIDFFATNSCKQLHDITVEIDRYINWPGQALAYKIGELKFKELRKRASDALGPAFDVRRFHNACLENGALPLSILDARINEWIEAKK